MVLDMVGLSIVDYIYIYIYGLSYLLELLNPYPYITLPLLPKDVRFTSLIDHATYRPYILQKKIYRPYRTCCLRLWENIKLYLKLQ